VPREFARDVPAIQPDQIRLRFEAHQQPAVANETIRGPRLNESNRLDIETPDVSRDAPEIASSQVRNEITEPRAANTRPPQRIALASPTTEPAARDLPIPVARGTKHREARPAGHVSFNVGELWARAAGYRDGLRTVDSTLVEAGDFSPSDLAELLDELEDLLNQRRDLLLYEQVVSGQDRERLVGSLTFPQATVAVLGSRIARVRERLAAITSGDNSERDRQLRKLESLSLRLSKLHQE
jgi:hypothetical protein